MSKTSALLQREVQLARFNKKRQIFQNAKIYRQNLISTLVITETSKTPFEPIVNTDIYDYPTRNYALF